MTDKELKDSILNPADGQGVKVRGNAVLDGNGRLKEAAKRGLFKPEDVIPVDDLGQNDDIAPWEKDLDVVKGQKPG
ncbi:hypothetical protein [Mesorhizobium sp. M0047]|uniref:hypothetical protein n=1 Tax=Mesorhizobium sp. M0047 TaxID=2956859 RepID=UPI003339DC6A